MLPRITNVRHLHDYVLELTFDDNLRAELDFRNRIVGRGGVLKPLETVDFFRQVRSSGTTGCSATRSIRMTPHDAANPAARRRLHWTAPNAQKHSANVDGSGTKPTP